ncbi:MAG: hypothetical protein B6245_04575 [Desulfobacteraceae bacterium 4572_88]|nr:MAG: hypothetical protein B6245_04575 [Desulfobacteraceae bacterium 4572_88]
MIRLLIFFGLIYFGYRMVKTWIIRNIAVSGGQARNEIDDVMIKDPVCEVYFPKRDGVHLSVDGQDVYFCSEECRDKFMESRFKD